MAKAATSPPQDTWPRLRNVGIDGILVSFGDSLDEPANRAALAFRAAVETAGWSWAEESATSLVSAYIRFDPLFGDFDQITTDVVALLDQQNWYDAPLPQGRRLWRIPTVYGTDLAPQLEEAAQAAGLTPDQAIANISTTTTRVQTIGFAPGQPYLGELDPCWDIPRQTTLTKQVPAAAVVVAIRQLVIFSGATPTGWRHIGQTGFQLFRPDEAEPFMLRPGDEVLFTPTTPPELENMIAIDPDGGAMSEVIK